MAALHLRVMGGFAAVLSTGQPVEVSGKKNRALLTYLALMLQVADGRRTRVSPEAPADHRPNPQSQSPGRRRPRGSFEFPSRYLNHCVFRPISGTVGGLDGLDFRREA